jgi:hypothetical protein
LVMNHLGVIMINPSFLIFESDDSIRSLKQNLLLSLYKI